MSLARCNLCKAFHRRFQPPSLCHEVDSQDDPQDRLFHALVFQLDDDELVECFSGSAAGAALDDDELGLCPALRPV